MTKIQTPYLDKELDNCNTILKYRSHHHAACKEAKSKLQEYQSIKEALKRLEELEEAAIQALHQIEYAQKRFKKTATGELAIQKLKTVLEK